MFHHNRTILSLMLAICLLIPGLALGDTPKATDPELNEVYHQYILTRLDRVIELGFFTNWSLEDRAAVDRILVDAGQQALLGPCYNDMPSGADLPQAAALKTAQDIVLEQFGEDMTASWDVNYTFLRSASGEGQWSLRFFPVPLPAGDSHPCYIVTLHSPTGQVESFEEQNWANPSPEEELPKETKPGYISPAEAQAIGLKAVLDTYGMVHRLTEDTLSKFLAGVALFPTENGGEVYNIDIRCPDSEAGAYFGQFMADIDPTTGEVVNVTNQSNG